MLNPSLSWQKLQDVYYSIRPCYENVKWSVENIYANCHIKISTQGTLLALASKFVPNPNVIEVFSLSGTKIWSLVYNSSPQDHIVDFCFYGEDLLVVLANQRFRWYTDFNGTFNEYNFTQPLLSLTASQSESTSEDPKNGEIHYVITNLENNEQELPFHVQYCRCWGNYLVFFYINQITFTKLSSMENFLVPLNFVTSLSVALVSATDSTLECILSHGSSICKLSVDFDELTYQVNDQGITDGPFSIMSVSPNGSFVALLNAMQAKIYVITKEFDRVLLEYDTSNESSTPYMMEWSGNDAIILSLRDEIKLIGPAQKSVSFFYDLVEQDDFDLDMILTADTDLSFTIPIIHSHSDGLKIITKSKVEFLSRVPESSVNLHLVGSSHPSLILLDCVEKLGSQASKADSNISLLKNENSLDLAIRGCLSAALEEFYPSWQKRILKSVSFGKIYHEGNFDADEYLKVLNTLKVLNQLRSLEIGLFFTYSEIQETGWETVIRMLLNRSQHLLALLICKLLKLTDFMELVYIDWCVCKIRKEMSSSDVDLFRTISKKLLSRINAGSMGFRNLISVSEISEVAFQEGRTDLCKLLINLEPSGLKKMSQLLHIDEVETALLKCFQTCDFDLCKLLLLSLRDTHELPELLGILNQNEIKNAVKEVAALELNQDEDIKPYFREYLYLSGDLIGNFFQNTIAAKDPDLLNSYLKHEDKSLERALDSLKSFIKLEEGEPIETETEFEQTYNARKEKLKKIGYNRKLKKMIDAELELLEVQLKHSNNFRQSFFDEKSIVDVIKKLIRLYQVKPAAKLVKDFKVPQEKFWYLVLEIYCQSKEFDRLHKFILASNSNASSWKSPIGFPAIVETCMIYGAPKDMISNYIEQSSGIPYTQKVELYIRNEDLILAAEEAFLNKNAELLRQIQKKVLEIGDENVLKAVKSFLNRLGY